MPAESEKGWATYQEAPASKMGATLLKCSFHSRAMPGSAARHALGVGQHMHLRTSVIAPELCGMQIAASPVRAFLMGRFVCLEIRF